MERAGKIRVDHRFGLLLVLVAEIAGCADVSFKAGASPEQIRQDELACRDVSEDDEAAYSSCMKERGYVVAGPDGGVEWAPRSR